MNKPAAAWNPRTTAPWICQFCGKKSATDSLNLELHEPTCDQRPEEGK